MESVDRMLIFIDNSIDIMCLTKKEIEGSLLTIPYFEDYPERDDQRVNLYLKECTALYELLYDSRFLK